MKICIVGKFPPIEGGVSMHTYRYAHSLAQKGHQVHVVTNATEVGVPYRMFMRDEDWARCEGDYGEGYVRVHWTDPYDRKQWHIPSSNPFVSKLTSIGAQVCADYDIDVVFSFYLEPYGVAGHLIAQMAELPHVVKTAGSDAGKLWQNPQFQPLYNHIFKSAAFIVAAGPVFEDLRAMGLDPSRFRPDRDLTVPEDIFCPDGPSLDVEFLCQQIAASPDYASLQWGRIREGIPYIGVYGKLGETKGTFALLRALARVIESGRDVGLLVMGHEHPKSPVKFRHAVSELSLDDHVVQFPFLPHWRVPEFIRRCVAVCCLEQDFPIAIHTPIMPREVLCCGGTLIGSTEMIRKLPQNDRLIHGHSCSAVNDVNDITELSNCMVAALDVWDSADAMGRRARAYVLDVQKSLKFPERLEQTLELAIAGQVEKTTSPAGVTTPSAFRLARIAIDAMHAEDALGLAGPPPEPEREMAWAEGVLEELIVRANGGDGTLASIRDAVKFNICLVRASSESDPDAMTRRFADQLFRLNLRERTNYPDDVLSMIPWRLPHVVTHRFGCDVNNFLKATETGNFRMDSSTQETYAVFLADERGRGVRTIVLDATAGRLLDVCNGTSTVSALDAVLRESNSDRNFDELWVAGTVNRFFEIGLIGLTDSVPAVALA